MFNRLIDWFCADPKWPAMPKYKTKRGRCVECGQQDCESRPMCPDPKIYSCLFWHPPGTIIVVEERPER